MTGFCWALHQPIQKGGGYSRGWREAVDAPPKHRYWTGTNDEVPRSSGVPPVDGGLPKPPNFWIRFVRWVSYYARWIWYQRNVKE